MAEVIGWNIYVATAESTRLHEFHINSYTHSHSHISILYALMLCAYDIIKLINIQLERMQHTLSLSLSRACVACGCGVKKMIRIMMPPAWLISILSVFCLCWKTSDEADTQPERMFVMLCLAVYFRSGCLIIIYWRCMSVYFGLMDLAWKTNKIKYFRYINTVLQTHYCTLKKLCQYCQ